MELTQLIESAIKEDIPSIDVTTHYILNNPDTTTTVAIVAKQTGVFFGEHVITTLFNQFDPACSVQCHVSDGDIFSEKEVICKISAPASIILKAERILLNLLQHLCGVATQTRAFVDALNQPSIKVLDTRKTTPLHRDLEKQAVVAGGGFNHRSNLSDMILIKENHIRAFLAFNTVDGFNKQLQLVKQTQPEIPIEIEIERVDQLTEFDLDCVDIIMFDNFSIVEIEQAIQVCRIQKKYQAQLEISGNMTLETIGKYRDLDIDRISVGRLTHSVPAVDLSLQF